jgi:hypothetical protein
MTVADAPDPLVSTREHRLEGGDPPHLDPALARVRRGYYRAAGQPIGPDRLYELRIMATARARTSPLVFSHASAAALWGCPQLAADTALVQVTCPGRARRTTARVQVHRSALPDEDTVVLPNGLLVTSRARTAVDVAASGRLPDVLLPLDYLVRALVEELGESVEGVREHLAGLVPVGVRGRSRALRNLAVADPRSGSAGESLSRGQMILLGVAMPELQVSFAHDGGEDVVDFDWAELGVFGEYDGRAKYVDPAFTQGRSPEAVLWAEKDREDRIRRVRPVGARWGWSDALSCARLGRILARAGVEPATSAKVSR